MASGDLQYQAVITGTLSGAQRAALGSVLGAIWSGQLSDLEQVNFTKNADGTVAYQLFGQASAPSSSLPLNVRVTGRVP